MLPHHTFLESFLRDKSKDELIQLISTMYQRMPDKSIWELLGDQVYEINLRHLSPTWLREKIDIFYADSIAGKYYDDSDIGSMNVPEQTEVWICVLENLLDLCCEMSSQGHTDPARAGLTKLIDLFENKTLEEEIVHADEFGEWMINCRHDYRSVFKSLS